LAQGYSHMKLLFLDIDGVLVTRRLGVFEDSLLKNLKRVVESTGATIVLSSDWRRHPAARLEAKRVLATVGLTFIACTPALNAYIAQRPTEILQWKKEYCKRPDAERISHWIAIDDRPLIEERHGSYLRGHFVQTQPIRGLTEQNSDECIALLNQEVSSRDPGFADTGDSVAQVGVPDRDNLMAGLRGNSTGSGLRGASTETGKSLLGASTRKTQGSLPAPAQGLAALGAPALGPGVHSFGLANQGGDNGQEPVAGLPSLGRQRGRSTGAPPMVGGRR